MSAAAGQSKERTPQFAQSGVFTQLGLQNAEEKYEALREVRGYHYTVAPISKFEARAAKMRLERLIGSDPNNPRFTPEIFDRTRERLQLLDKKERESMMEAIGLVYSQKLSSNFVANVDVRHAEFEKLLYPRHLPTYAEALSALGLRRQKPFWRQGNFCTLENISRLPLDFVSFENKETQLSFEDWYSLFWNYYTPFNLCGYYHMLTNQSTILTKEFIDDFADYLAERLRRISEVQKQADVKAPIIALGARTGNLAWHLNNTNKLPVKVIACHERPNQNPYLLAIPPEKQADFALFPIQPLKWDQALEKYQPCIVLLSELEPNKDQTQLVRGYGCVREYVHVGMSDSYVEGNGWETWGGMRYRPEDDKRFKPPYVEGGWCKVTLPHLSRYLLHKLDSTMAMGFGSATSFCRMAVAPGPGEQLRRVFHRIVTRY